LATLVLAGGTGDNAPLARARIREGLIFLGIELNESRNAETAGVIPRTPTVNKKKAIEHDESYKRLDGWRDGRRDVALDGDRPVVVALLVVVISKLSKK